MELNDFEIAPLPKEAVAGLHELAARLSDLGPEVDVDLDMGTVEIGDIGEATVTATLMTGSDSFGLGYSFVFEDGSAVSTSDGGDVPISALAQAEAVMRELLADLTAKKAEAQEDNHSSLEYEQYQTEDLVSRLSDLAPPLNVEPGDGVVEFWYDNGRGVSAVVVHGMYHVIQYDHSDPTNKSSQRDAGMTDSAEEAERWIREGLSSGPR